MPLPENVFGLRNKDGSIRYYHQIGRSGPKDARSDCTRIPYETRDPRFHAMAARLNGAPEAVTPPDTFTAAIQRYKASPGYLKKSEATRAVYGLYLRDVERAWGPQSIVGLHSAAVVAFRDRTAGQRSANTANACLSALRAFLVWCVGAGLAPANVARDVPLLDHEPETTRPWPEEAWRCIVDEAPPHLSRLAYLGRATGQRISDLLRMRPADRHEDGIKVRIKKLGGKAHWQALGAAEIATIDSWPVVALQPYIHAPGGARISDNEVRKTLRAWIAAHAPELKALDLSPHGLRALALCDARLAGLEHQQISSLYNLSIGMVVRYTRHIDAEQAGRMARARMERGGNVKRLGEFVKRQ